jgi:putative NIF3 family GTP cyclohydrolase 1 type 2
MREWSRREFVRIGTAAAAAPLIFDSAAQPAAPTAQEIVDRIKRSLGVEWMPATVDTFKAGDPSTVVTGVVTASLATIDVMRNAVKSGANMVIASGPTFYSRADGPTPPAGRGAAAAPSPDPVYGAKNELISTNKLVVWRFLDHWRMRRPEPFAQGLIDALGLAAGGERRDPYRVTVPATTLERFAGDVRTRLNVRGGMRIVGDRSTRVRTVGVLAGSTAIQTTLTLLPEVDVLITGEIREWESSEYVRDAVTAGLGKGLILIGRSLSEEPGMRVCAEWLQTLIPEVPCRWTPIADPYWSAA